MYDRHKEEIIAELQKIDYLHEERINEREYIEESLDGRICELRVELADTEGLDMRIKYFRKIDKFQYCAKLDVTDIKNEGFTESQVESLGKLFLDRIEEIMNSDPPRDIHKMKITRTFYGTPS